MNNRLLTAKKIVIAMARSMIDDWTDYVLGDKCLTPEELVDVAYNLASRRTGIGKDRLTDDDLTDADLFEAICVLYESDQ